MLLEPIDVWLIILGVVVVITLFGGICCMSP
nr:MAG TPA: Renal amino acid transporter [Caudoviricetes sp.]